MAMARWPMAALLRREALRGAHGKPGRARALAWNRMCGAIGFESSDASAIDLMRPAAY